jgi:thiol-disulfide isomerase/thioredoxin
VNRTRRLLSVSLTLAAFSALGPPTSATAAEAPAARDLRRAVFTREIVNLEYAAETMQSSVPYPLTRAASIAPAVWYGTIRRRLPGDAPAERRNRIAFAASYRSGLPAEAVYDANLNGDLADDAPVKLYAYPDLPGARAFLADLRWAAAGGDVQWTLRVVLEPLAPSATVPGYRLQTIHAMSGAIALGGREHRAVLVDGNRDGWYTKSQGDGILIDHDDDLRLDTDAMSPEYGPFRVPFQAGSRRCEVVAVDPRGESVLYRDLGEAPPVPQAQIGEPAPDFTAQDADGKRVSLASLRGKVVLVDFWASSCARCEAQAAALREFYESYRARGLEIVGISYDTDLAKASEFRARHGQTWPADVSGWSFDENAIGRLYKANGAGTIFLVDRAGILEGTYVETDPLRERLEALLSAGAAR